MRVATQYLCSKLKEFVNDGSDDEDAVNESSNAVLVNESSNAVLVNESSNLKEFLLNLLYLQLQQLPNILYLQLQRHPNLLYLPLPLQRLPNLLYLPYDLSKSIHFTSLHLRHLSKHWSATMKVEYDLLQREMIFRNNGLHTHIEESNSINSHHITHNICRSIRRLW